MPHNYTQSLNTENFTVEVSPDTNYGYFEHNTLGDECGGGLWFDGKELIDYDGVFELPKEVEAALIAAGYSVWEDEA